MSKKDILLRFGTSTHARELSVREMSVKPLYRLCVEHVEEAAKESALFVHDERSE